MHVRPAVLTDVPACVGLIEAKRRQYAVWEPRFWRKSGFSSPLTAAWFARLFSQRDAVALVADDPSGVIGFIIGMKYPAPPVYDPGGANALIDDFAVKDDRWQDIGSALLMACRAELRKRGYAQIVVVAAEKDASKNAFLRRAKLSLASVWWTGPA